MEGESLQLGQSTKSHLVRNIMLYQNPWTISKEESSVSFLLFEAAMQLLKRIWKYFLYVGKKIIVPVHFYPLILLLSFVINIIQSSIWQSFKTLKELSCYPEFICYINTPQSLQLFLCKICARNFTLHWLFFINIYSNLSIILM